MSNPAGHAGVPEGLAGQLADVVVGIRNDVDVSRHVVRGEARYIVRDPISFQSHSLSLKDYHVYRSLTGNRTLHETFRNLVAEGRLGADQEESFYRFVIGLNQRGLLNLPITNARKLYERFSGRRKAASRMWFLKLFCFQLPLWNPDRFLNRTMAWMSFLFSPWFMYLWLLAAGLSGWILWTRWDEFQSPLASILALQNIPMTMLLIVVLKFWHELGHAYACKKLGGKVPEMGALFIVGAPCAYVDASASWSFSRRRDRIMVNLGGIYFESFVAIAAVFLWTFSDANAFWNSIAHRTIVVSTIVTFFFNLNPLMRYDGYYVLSDLLGIPNLRQESQRAVNSMAKRVVLGIDAPSVGRSWWSDLAFSGFGLASMLYKLVVIAGIAGVICYRLPVIGILAALVYGGSTIASSLVNLFRYLLFSQETRPVYQRARAVAFLVFVGLPATVALVPVSRNVALKGVTEQQHDVIVRAGTSGFLKRSFVQAGDQVSAEQVACELDNAVTRIHHVRARNELEKKTFEKRSRIGGQPQSVADTEQEWLKSQRQFQRAEDQQRALVVRIPIEGVVTECVLKNGDGQFVKHGDPLLRIGAGEWMVRAVASSEQLADSVPQVGQAARIQLAGSPDQVYSGRILQIAPAGSRRIRSEALTHVAKGDIPVHVDRMEAAQPFFEMVMAFDAPEVDELPLMRVGMRAEVRIVESSHSLGYYAFRQILQFYNQYLKS